MNKELRKEIAELKEANEFHLKAIAKIQQADGDIITELKARVKWLEETYEGDKDARI